MKRPWLSTVALAGLLAACGVNQGPAPSEPSASEPVVIGDWLLTGGSVDGVDAPVLDDHRITLTITGRTIGGTSACNSYGGEIRVEADGLHLQNLSMTDMACEEPAMAAESEYLDALARVRALTRDGEELVASGDGVELRFAAVPPPPTAEVVGTRWVLDTLLVGDVAASPMGEPATLMLLEDGTFSGSTGCRHFSGEWTEQGDQILAPSWGMDETECPAELTDQDSHVVSVIGDGFIPSVEGELLTLMDPGGVGLVYRAEE